MAEPLAPAEGRGGSQKNSTSDSYGGAGGGDSNAFEGGPSLGPRSETGRSRQRRPSSRAGRDAIDHRSWGGDGGSSIGQGGWASVKSRRIPLGGLPRGVAGNVKASFVGANVEELPVWGGLDWIAGTALLVDCRTPEQWRTEQFQPTAPVSFRGIGVPEGCHGFRF